MVEGRQMRVTRRRRARRGVVVCLLLITPLVSGRAHAQGEVRGTITVSAAASLRDAFTEIGKAFRAQHPSVKVRFNFGSSGTLVAQIASGAPVDVAAFADRATMDRLVSSGLVGSVPVVFARNSMTIVVKKGNPLFVQGRLTREEWEAKHGTKKTATRIMVESFQFLGGKDAAARPQQSAPARKTVTQLDLDDEPPF